MSRSEETTIVFSCLLKRTKQHFKQQRIQQAHVTVKNVKDWKTNQGNLKGLRSPLLPNPGPPRTFVRAADRRPVGNIQVHYLGVPLGWLIDGYDMGHLSDHVITIPISWDIWGGELHPLLADEQKGIRWLFDYLNGCQRMASMATNKIQHVPEWNPLGESFHIVIFLFEQSLPCWSYIQKAIQTVSPW